MKKKIVIWILSVMMVFVSIVSGAAFAETQDDNTEVLYFENARATFCSFTEMPRTVEF